MTDKAPAKENNGDNMRTALAMFALSKRFGAVNLPCYAQACL